MVGAPAHRHGELRPREDEDADSQTSERKGRPGQDVSCLERYGTCHTASESLMAGPATSTAIARRRSSNCSDGRRLDATSHLRVVRDYRPRAVLEGRDQRIAEPAASRPDDRAARRGRGERPRRSSKPTSCSRISQLSRWIERMAASELLDTGTRRAYAAPEQRRRAPRAQRGAARQPSGRADLRHTTALTRVTLQVRAVQLMALIDPRARATCSSGSISTSRRASAQIRWRRPVDECYTTLGRDRGRGVPGQPRRLPCTSLELLRCGAPPAVQKYPGGRARAIQRFRAGTGRSAPYLEGLLRLILRGSSRDAAGLLFRRARHRLREMADLQIADTALGVTGFERDGRAAERISWRS
mgnify:CR=1 FL=1